jgi:hypothetical protein
MAPAMVPAAALVAPAALEGLPAAALGLRHPTVLIAFSAMVVAASAAAPPETLIAAAPVGFEISLRRRACDRSRFAQAEETLQTADEAEGLCNGSRKGLGRS